MSSAPTRCSRLASFPAEVVDPLVGPFFYVGIIRERSGNDAELRRERQYRKPGGVLKAPPAPAPAPGYDARAWLPTYTSPQTGDCDTHLSCWTEQSSGLRRHKKKDHHPWVRKKRKEAHSAPSNHCREGDNCSSYSIDIIVDFFITLSTGSLDAAYNLTVNAWRLTYQRVSTGHYWDLHGLWLHRGLGLGLGLSIA